MEDNKPILAEEYDKAHASICSTCYVNLALALDGARAKEAAMLRACAAPKQAYLDVAYTRDVAALKAAIAEGVYRRAVKAYEEAHGASLYLQRMIQAIELAVSEGYKNVFLEGSPIHWIDYTKEEKE